MSLPVVKSIMPRVRAFYAGHGPKSNNKVYMQSTKERLGWDEFDQMRAQFLAKMGAHRSREERRNRNVDRIDQEHLRFSGSGRTYYEKGESIWKKGASGTEVSGNCGEMSFVSIYLAIAEYFVDPKTVWYATINSPGDHAFCLIGPTSMPNWANVNEMSVYNSGTASAVIADPWLKTACHAVNYGEFADDVVKKWHGTGKRIAWSGADGKKPGWYDPSRTYANAFITSPLRFTNAVTKLWVGAK